MSVKKLTIDDWNDHNRRAAARQGWQLLETEFHSSTVVICGIDDESDPDVRTEFNSGSSTNDEQAMLAMKESFLRNEDHAILAYNIIKNQSATEFFHWAMESWKVQKSVDVD